MKTNYDPSDELDACCDSCQRLVNEAKVEKDSLEFETEWLRGYCTRLESLILERLPENAPSIPLEEVNEWLDGWNKRAFKALLSTENEDRWRLAPTKKLDGLVTSVRIEPEVATPEQVQARYKATVCAHGSLSRSCELCERDEEIAELKATLDGLKTVADEAFGPFPVQTPEEALVAIEEGIFKLRSRRCVTCGWEYDSVEGCQCGAWAEMTEEREAAAKEEIARLKAEKDTLAEVSRAIIDRLERENKDLLRDALTLERVKSVLATGGE